MCKASRGLRQMQNHCVQENVVANAKYHVQTMLCKTQHMQKYLISLGLKTWMHIMQYRILWIRILQYSNPKIKSFFKYLDLK